MPAKPITTKIIKFLKNEKHDSYPKKDLILKIIFFAFLAYTIWSVFPISPIEADGVSIANGIEFMKRHGFGDNEFAYRFPAQPGSYLIIFGISELFNIKAYLAFSLISAFTTILFIFSSSYLLSKITNGSFYLIGVLHFLFQEVLAVSAYANTTIIACSLIILGMSLLYHSDKVLHTIFSALLIGFGVFCRLDVGLIVIPFAIFLIINEKKLPKNLITSGVLSLLFFYFLLQINQISIQQITHLFRLHSTAHFINENISEFALVGYKDVRSVISFFSIASLGLICLGLLYIIQKKKWSELALTSLGTVPFFYIFFGNLTSPRYIMSTLPFFILAVYYGIQYLMFEKTTLKKVFSIIIVLIFFGQYMLGIQVDVKSKPYREQMKPVFAKLLSIPNPTANIKSIMIVAGSGSSISTDDGYRLTSGILYYPVFWHEEKVTKLSNIEPLETFITTDTQDTLGVLCNDLDACHFCLNLLLSNDYELTRLEENVYKATGINNINLLIQNNGDDFPIIESNLAALSNDQIIFVSTIPATNYSILEKIPSLQKKSDLIYIYKK